MVSFPRSLFQQFLYGLTYSSWFQTGESPGSPGLGAGRDVAGTRGGGVRGPWPTALCRRRGGGGGQHGSQGDELHHETDAVLLQHRQCHLQRHHRLRQLLQVGPSPLSHHLGRVGGTLLGCLCQDPRAAACTGAMGDAVQRSGGLWYPDRGGQGAAVVSPWAMG